MKKIKNIKIISKNRRKYYLKIHLVMVIKYRKRLLKNEFKNYIHNKMNEISNNYEFNIEEINSDENHIHLLINYTPNITICSIVRILKQETTFHSWLNYNTLLNNYFYREKTLWSDGYFVSSVGYLDEGTIKEYIKNQ